MTTLPSHLQSIVTANSAIYEAPVTENSIRIVHLLPGHVDEPISCTFDIMDLEKVESFQALSYCWGSEHAHRPLFCNGQPFTPTRNLYAALKQLRLTSGVRYMWIDAICINQDSITERNQQVPLMRQIYQKATQVIVWLGGQDDTTALALATMQSIFESCCSERYGDTSREEWLTNLENDEEYCKSLRGDIVRTVSPEWPGEPKTCTNALQKFFQRPWFSRVWVIQEVRGCPHITLQIGETTLAWNIVASVAAWVVYGPTSVTHLTEPYKFGGFLHTDLMQQKPFTTKDDVPFLEVLDRCRGFKCTIDKDRIFALLQHTSARLLPSENELGTANKMLYPLRMDIDQRATHFGLKVDYNMTLREVYRQIVLGSISEGRSLQVLSHAIEDSKYRKDYPTWMPLWHATSSRFTGPRRTFLYNASRDHEPQVRTFTNPMLLGLDGVEVGIVTKTSTNIILSDANELQTEEINHGTTLAEIQEISRLIVRDCWQPEHNWMQEAVCRTRSQATTHFADFCAFISERLQKTPGPTLLSLHGKWCNICMARHVTSPASGLDEILEIFHCETCFDFDMCMRCRKAGHTCPGQHELSPRPIPSMICQLGEQTHAMLEAQKGNGNAERFDLGVRQSFDGKCFVKLSNGLLGLASDKTRVGDLVVVFFGGRVPFILRQQGSFYALLGECYVHGIMDGEAIDGWRKGILQQNTFILE
ncbi:heterokaryon incompatibility protein-domain-containing protein [Cadophora sp. MPI-SDFR-AT-0126]|nr:heterokaryon incompatibility protein-domain-containing protein [Leotiomycetes sp. MPI-SDFR-AT-0126]